MPDADRTQEHIAAELAEIDEANRVADTGDEARTQSPRVDPAIEKEAEKHGWVPKEKYRGDPTKWKPADQYIDDGLRYNKNIRKDLDDLRAKYEESDRMGKAFARFHEETIAKKDQEIKDALAANRRAIRQANRDGDDDLVDTLEARQELLEEERRTLKKEPVETPAATTTPTGVRDPNVKVNPMVQEWIEDGNDWFEKDMELAKYANDVAIEMRNSGEKSQGREMLDKVAARVRADFPRRFKKAPEERRNDQTSSDSGRSAEASGQYSIHDLPAEDRALMKYLIGEGRTTKEKFLNSYFSGDKKVHRTKS